MTRSSRSPIDFPNGSKGLGCQYTSASPPLLEGVVFISVKATEWAFEKSASIGISRLVLLAIAASVNTDGYAWPGLEEIQRRTKLSKGTVFRAISELEAQGEIIVERGGGRNNPNRYFFRAFMETVQNGPNGPNSSIYDEKRSETVQSDGRNGPYTETVIISNNKNKNKNKKQEEAGLPKNGSSLTLPSWIDSKTWKDYLEMRMKIKKPMTEAAMRLAVRTLSALRAKGANPQEILEQSIMNSWQGLFPLHSRQSRRDELLQHNREVLDRVFGKDPKDEGDEGYDEGS